MRFIGCKTLLLDNIHDVIKKHVKDAHTFCDIFSGTGTVGRYFKQFYEVYSNDILYFSYALQKATIEVDETPQFNTLKNKLKIQDPIDYFNSLQENDIEKLPKHKRFFQNNYSPVGNRMYINDNNALRIDFARNTVEDWFKNNLIDEKEYSYLIACIVEGIPFVSNISGTYGAYHKQWDKRTYKKYELCRLPIYTNNKNNKCFNEEGVSLLKKIKGDILYIDPPYNERQYLPNYHVLETAAKYDNPKLKGVTGQREYENQKSDFCSSKTVIQAFENLISNAQFKHIILSYSTDGLMSLNDIENIMNKYAKPNSVCIYKIPYRRYKSRKQTNKEELKEILVYMEKLCI
ncbi:MAG: adenine methyltransferase [Alphaproteobacteria bacterium]|nr:adenine methyltransferase [Alphaproteobacteria bacterium]